MRLPALLLACLLAPPALAQETWVAGPQPPGAPLMLRTGPAPEFGPIGRLAPGTGPLTLGPCVLLRGDRAEADPAALPEWCRVSRNGQPLGWVPAQDLIPAEGALRDHRGWRHPDDACRLLGETPLTADFLDDSADLVGCPDGHPDIPALRRTRGARELAHMLGLTLLSIPRR